MTDKYIFNLIKFQNIINDKEQFTKKDLINDIINSFENIDHNNYDPFKLMSSLVFNFNIYPSLIKYFDYTASTILYNTAINYGDDEKSEKLLNLKDHIEELWSDIITVSDNDLP